MTRTDGGDSFWTSSGTTWTPLSPSSTIRPRPGFAFMFAKTPSFSMPPPTGRPEAVGPPADEEGKIAPAALRIQPER